jgi:hypothetical protein
MSSLANHPTSATEKTRGPGSADAVLAVLTAAAEVGAPCPSNLDLSRLLGAETRGWVPPCRKRLERAVDYVAAASPESTAQPALIEISEGGVARAPSEDLNARRSEQHAS